jgi:hypothetical protein
MRHTTPLQVERARAARAARAIVETALDRRGWPWLRRLSLWLDALAAIEEPGG